MAESEHVCKNCDHIIKIAKDEGFFSWKTIWDKQSGELKGTRKDPSMLFKGDSHKFGGDLLKIPDKSKHKESCAVDAKYKFEVPTSELYLYIRILRDNFEPVKNASYELTVPGANEDKPFTGKTDADGLIDVKKPIPLGTVKATLTVRVKAEDTDPPPEKPKEGSGPAPKPAEPKPTRGEVPVTWELEVGALHPVLVDNARDSDCISGVQQRLNNICMNTGPIDGILGPNTKAAVNAFQELYGMKKNVQAGVPCKLTQQKLADVHDGPGPAPKPPEKTEPKKEPAK